MVDFSRKQSVEEARAHEYRLRGLRERNVITDEEMRSTLIFVVPDNIRYDQGGVRPGELGRWDLFYLLEECGIPYAKRLLIAGLTDDQVQKEERRDHMRQMGVDVDDPADVRDFERIERMSPGELDDEIKKLRGLLAST